MRSKKCAKFAIDQAPSADTWHITEAYRLLRQLKPYLRGKHSLRSWGLLFSQDDREREITDGTTVITCRHNFTLPWDPRATDGSTWPEGGGIVIRLASNEYLVAGNGIVVEWKTTTEKQQEQQQKLGEDGFLQAGSQPTAAKERSAHTTFWGKRLGIAFVDQVSVNADGTFCFIRRDNGDQDHQGRHARIGVGEYKILHVKLYEY